MLQRREQVGGPVTYVSPLLSQLDVPHAYTTRLGGVSPVPKDSLDLANVDRVPGRENLRRVLASLGLADHRLCTVHQVHGCDVYLARACPDTPPTAPRPEADAIVTRESGTVAMIRTADCVPILLADPHGLAVAAVHAGWRGVVAGVVPRAAAALARLADCSPADLVAAIGPAIGVDRFEVGDEVVKAFEEVGLGRAVVRATGFAKPHIDLKTAVVHQLIGIGLSQRRIDTTDRCTFRDTDEFFSHRRDAGRAGRQAALIAPAPR
jgi:purine-nucleoside/S-methyl-5'-thioadenosine phosphorylase / adenosine deaminase